MSISGMSYSKGNEQTWLHPSWMNLMNQDSKPKKNRKEQTHTRIYSIGGHFYKAQKQACINKLREPTKYLGV